MNISRCMKRNVVSIPEISTIREAAASFVKARIGLLSVVDKDDKPVGVVGLQDLLSLELPDFVHDFGAVEVSHPPARVIDQSTTTLMKPAIMVHENSGSVRAYALLLQHKLHDMLVLSVSGKLVGVASGVEIGAAILSTWANEK